MAEMTISIANVGMRAREFHTPVASIFGLASLAKTVSALAIPTISMYALSNLPAAEAKHAKFTDGKDGDVFAQCIEACDKNGKDAHEFAKLLCYTMCAVISLFKKNK